MDNKLLVIGLDGGTFDLLGPWMEQGLLPNLQRIRAGGTSDTLRTVIPPITAPAWTSFYTGKNPGKHGVFDFLRKKEDSYEEIPVNASFCKSKTLWDLLGEGDKKIAVLNVPMTYPPRKVNGVMICGFLSSAKNRDYVYPPQLLDEIEEQFGPYYAFGRNADAATPFAEKHLVALIDDCSKMSEYKFKVAHFLMKKDDYDVIVFHEWATDRIQHWLWHIIDQSHPKHDTLLAQKYLGKILDYYRSVDHQIGKTMELMGSRSSVCIMSDHGFCPVKRSIDLNVWLLEEGYITIKKSFASQIRYWLWRQGLTYEALVSLFAKLIKLGLKPKSRAPREVVNLLRIGPWQLLLSLNDADWYKTKAYAKSSPFGQIVLNLKGREPQGTINPGEEYDHLVSQIVAKLKNLRDPQDGSKINGLVYTKEEAFKGPFSSNAPDIIYLPQQDGYQAGNVIGFGSNTPFVNFTGFNASHSMDGIFMIKGPDIRQGASIKGAAITDLAPTILHLMGLRVPDDMDGTVLKDIFTDAFLKKNPIEYYTPSEVTEDISGTTVSTEEEEIKQRLKNLGYF
jgi:predicted AlkP superfamily phosphohydrolase/phosphomutase